MKRLLIATILMAAASFASAQKNISFSVNYQYLNKTGKHGMGAGFKTKLWNNTLLLTDVNYFFKKYEGTFHESSQTESYKRHAAFNLNLGYNLLTKEKTSFIPYAGLGIFYQNTNGYISSEGRGSAVGIPPGLTAPHYVPVDDSFTALLSNFGFLVEHYVSEHVFLTGGLKLQLDLYDGTYNDFPGLTVGVGYKL